MSLFYVNLPNTKVYTNFSACWFKMEKVIERNSAFTENNDFAVDVISTLSNVLCHRVSYLLRCLSLKHSTTPVLWPVIKSKDYTKLYGLRDTKCIKLSNWHKPSKPAHLDCNICHRFISISTAYSHPHFFIWAWTQTPYFLALSETANKQIWDYIML